MKQTDLTKLAIIGIFLILLIAQPGTVSDPVETFQENGNFPIKETTLSALPDSVESFDTYYAAIADDFYTEVDFSTTYDMDRTMIWWSASENTTFLGTDDIDELGVSLEIIDSDTIRLHKDDHAMIYNGWAGSTQFYKIYVLEWSTATGIEVEHLFGEDSFGVYPIGDTVDPDHAFVFNWGSEGTYTGMHSSGVGLPRVLNSTHYELINPGYTADMMTDQFVQIVHDDGTYFTVYNGSKYTVGSEYNVTDSIGGTIDPSKTLAFSGMDVTLSNTVLFPTRYGAGLFLNSTHITYMSDPDVTLGVDTNLVYWWVVESDLFEVQYVTVPYASGDRDAEITINSVDTSITGVVTAGSLGGYMSWFGASIDMSSNVDEYNTYTPFGSSFKDSTTIVFNCSSGSTSMSSRHMIIEFQGIPNELPTNEYYFLSDPSEIVNSAPNEIFYTFARERDYHITTATSDGDGYADLETIDLYYVGAGGSTTIWKCRYTVSTDTFSEVTNGDYIQLNSYSTATRSGDWVNITWDIKFEWEHPRTQYYDIKIESTDGTDTDTDTNSTGNGIWAENRLGITNIDVIDYVGSDSRGDPDSTVTSKGRISYYGWTLEHWPLANETDVYTVCGGVTGSPWIDNVASNGFFATSVKSPNNVSSTTYTVRCVPEGEGADGNNRISNQPADQVNYITDRVSFSLAIDLTWQVVTYPVSITVTATYEYDSSSYSGTYTLNAGNKTTWGNQTYFVSSMSESTHGLTTWTNNSVYCEWDTILVSPSYYWVQYSPELVWLIWGSPSSYTWAMNSSGVGAGVVIESHINGTENAKATTYGSGDLSGLSIGGFDTSWYWVTVAIHAEGIGSYDWAIWTNTLEVDILHSLHIQNFEIEPTDYYFWIAFTTNLANASITIWDDAIDSGTLYSNAIYADDNEGFHSIARSTVIGTHNVTICINSDGNNYGRTYNVSDWVWWYNWTYVVQTDFILTWEPSIEETKIAVSGYVSKAATWEVFYDGSASSSYSGSVSAGYFDRIEWTKHEVPGYHSWKMTFTNGTDTIDIGGVFYTYQTNIDDKPDGNTPDPDLDWRRQQITWQNIMLVIIILGIVAVYVFPPKVNRSLDLPNLKE